MHYKNASRRILKKSLTMKQGWVGVYVALQSLVYFSELSIGRLFSQTKMFVSGKDGSNNTFK